VFFIAGLFWTVAAGTGYATVDGMTHLSSNGWLFTVEESVLHQNGIGNAWDYWSLFDFSKVEWSAMAAATENIVLLVVIGVLNLPIYIPAMALVLGVPSYNMNHELIGHGVSNIFAGVVGTIPNLVVSFSDACENSGSHWYVVVPRFCPTLDSSPTLVVDGLKLLSSFFSRSFFSSSPPSSCHTYRRSSRQLWYSSWA
jgi:hypothetical protein